MSVVFKLWRVFNLSKIAAADYVVYQEEVGDDVMKMSSNEIQSRTKLMDNEVKVTLCACACLLLSESTESSATLCD